MAKTSSVLNLSLPALCSENEAGLTRQALTTGFDMTLIQLLLLLAFISPAWDAVPISR